MIITNSYVVIVKRFYVGFARSKINPLLIKTKKFGICNLFTLRKVLIIFLV